MVGLTDVAVELFSGGGEDGPLGGGGVLLLLLLLDPLEGVLGLGVLFALSESLS